MNPAVFGGREHIRMRRGIECRASWRLDWREAGKRIAGCQTADAISRRMAAIVAA
jgi:hypothetical protein